MAQMADNEGCELPVNQHGVMMFDIRLSGDKARGAGPMLFQGIPSFFETDEGNYDGCGVLSIPLKNILEEYLDEFEDEDSGETLPELIALLRTYADKYEKALIARTQQSIMSKEIDPIK